MDQRQVAAIFSRAIYQPPPRKRTKAITKADVKAAVEGALRDVLRDVRYAASKEPSFAWRAGLSSAASIIERAIEKSARGAA